MNIFCSGVKIIFIDKILRIKLLRQLMTFLTVQLLFDKLSHVFNAFVFHDLLNQKCFGTYGGRNYTLQSDNYYSMYTGCFRS
jgi:hypothetical protein